MKSTFHENGFKKTALAVLATFAAFVALAALAVLLKPRLTAARRQKQDETNVALMVVAKTAHTNLQES
jgi:hypothetical protein